MTRACLAVTGAVDAAALGQFAADCLKLELRTWPKPGLVSHVDSGSHADMDAALLMRSAAVLQPFFTDLASAGAEGAEMARLRVIGLEAERAMLAATDGVNTHRGAIFGMGLLVAAAGFRAVYGGTSSLGAIVATRFGAAILDGPQMLHSHGAMVARKYHTGGARAEAAAGFPSLYTHALPALAAARGLKPDDPEAVRVQVCMGLIAAVADTNLLYRGGPDGLAFAQTEARGFLRAGGIATADWRPRAEMIHQAFVARRLSPGGAADLLAMALFVDGVGP